MTHKKKDYPVGYKKPPKSGQFKKGQSGNTRGRPPKPKGRELMARQEDLHSILVFEMLAEHGYKLNGEEMTLPYVVLLIRKIKVDALNGDKAARKMLLEWWKVYLADKHAEKMKFFEMAREEELFTYWQMLEMNEKM